MLVLALVRLVLFTLMVTFVVGGVGVGFVDADGRDDGAGVGGVCVGRVMWCWCW